MDSKPDSTDIDRSEPIGFVGLGQMGGPMASHLARLGYPVFVYARSPAALEDAAEAGARIVPTIRDVASRARIVCICLNTKQASLDIVFGENGLASGDRIETLVDFSTTGTDFAAEFGQRLLERGIALLDSPISGNVKSAGSGGLGIMCSGPMRGFRQVEHVLHDLARPMVLYLGEGNGNAQRLKGLNNLVSSTGGAIASELFVLGTKWGLVPEIMLEVLNAGDASCNATRNKFGKDVLTRRFNYGARIEITSKDASNTVREGEDIGAPMWIGQSVRQLWKYAEQQGGGRLDGTALITYMEAWAGGVEVRNGANAEAIDASQVAVPEGEVVLVCDERLQAAISKRLATRQTQCTLLAVPAGSRAQDLLRAIAGKGTRAGTVVNLCAMRSTDSADLAQALGTVGDAYVDAAHLGTPRDLLQGRGAVVVSAPVALFERLRPLLEPLGAKLLRISSKAGAAHLMRNIDQCMSDALLAAACESYVVGAKAGIDPLDMAKILGVETGKCTASVHILPRLVAERNFDFGKSLGDACDELDMLSDDAREWGVTTWILDKVRTLYGLAAESSARDDDISRLAVIYEKWTGVEIRAGLGKASAVEITGADTCV